MTDRISVELTRDQWDVVVAELYATGDPRADGLADVIEMQTQFEHNEVDDVRDDILEIRRDLAALQARFDEEHKLLLTLRAETA